MKIKEPIFQIEDPDGDTILIAPTEDNTKTKKGMEDDIDGVLTAIEKEKGVIDPDHFEDDLAEIGYKRVLAEPITTESVFDRK